MLGTQDPQGVQGALTTALQVAHAADGPEAALLALTTTVRDMGGDPAAHLKPGGLKPGERQYRVAGCFFITPDHMNNMLIAGYGFPPEQRRLSIPIAFGHPGQVVRTEQPLHLANTDDHGEFRQYLKTSRMGSALFVPIFWRGRMLGQMVMAAQARNTFMRDDLDMLEAFAAGAGALWIAFDGPAFLAKEYPADPAESGMAPQSAE